MREKGFTMMELVIVLLIVTVVSGTMLLSLSSQQTHGLKSGAEAMATDIRYARGLALSSSRWIKFNIIGNKVYAVRWVAPGVAGENEIGHPLDGEQDFIVDYNLASSPSRGLGFDPVADACNGVLGMKDDDIYFDPEGVPTCCNTATHDTCERMAAPFSIPLTLQGKVGSLTVWPETGSVIVL